MTTASGLASDSQSKNHYEVLDGLRGVAALLVVAFHTLEPNDYGIRFNQIINHGYLAVDFFFLLSGFVVAYAYDDRWPRMSQWDFYKRRLIRLQPMIILGSLIGAAFFYSQRGTVFPLIAMTPPWKMLLVMLLGCTLLPHPSGSISAAGMRCIRWTGPHGLSSSSTLRTFFMRFGFANSRRAG